jgi:peptidase E
VGGGSILALGGMALDPLVVAYVLELTGKERPRVVHVPTATGDDPRVIVSFHAVAGPLGLVADHVELHGVPRSDWRELVAAADAILVTGGNTANMLAVWRVHGMDRALRDAHARGAVLWGSSAGMICWFESGVTDSFCSALGALPDGLGLLAGSACPHYDGEPLRRPRYHELVIDGALPGGVAADDGVGLHYRGGELVDVVAVRPGTSAYRVERTADGTIEETPLATRALLSG